MTVSAQHHLHAYVTQGQGQEVAANATVSFTNECEADALAKGHLQLAVELDTPIIHDILPETPLILTIQ